MVHCCRSLGRNHRPANPDRSSSRSASLGAKFVRPALSDAHVLSTLLPEAVAGLTRSSQAQPLTSSKSLPDKNARAPALGTPAAGNGIFGCRDRRPKIHPRDRFCRQRPGTLKIGGKIPAETASFRSTTVSAVREDWMVVHAVGYEPVSTPKFPVIPRLLENPRSA